ncbi:hypothetical protein [Xanthomonas campestris]|uniref:hypothetical protein n=1 Tax=Xanthomonas campestris TaxID=339 RepID=UPI00129018C6|nr:hypothetical protein [Xanthomonas campestris]
MPRQKLSDDDIMTTGWGSKINVEKGVEFERLNNKGLIELLDGPHRGRIGVLKSEATPNALGELNNLDEWVKWQFADFSVDVQDEIRSKLTKALRDKPEELIKAIAHALESHSVDTGNQSSQINDSALNVKHKFDKMPGTDFVLLFRFYSGQPSTLLSAKSQKPLPGRKQSSQPARLPVETAIDPKQMLKKKSLSAGAALGYTSESRSREMAHAHQEGHQTLSDFVSCGYNLPRLLRTPSTKVRIIIFGKNLKITTDGYDQATHLGFFLVPRSKLGEIIWKKGEMACYEREITFKGDGLHSHLLFKIKNPFHSESFYVIDQLPSGNFKFM